MPIEDWELKMKAEHYEKYEKLCQSIGLVYLRVCMPVSAIVVQEALKNGDEHLNTISLHLWDAKANSYSFPKNEKTKHLSLAERVCILKHFARYHFPK